MKLHNVEVQSLINEIEAGFFSLNTKTENILFDIIKEYRLKLTKNQKKNRNINSNVNQNQYSHLGGKSESKQIHDKIDFSFSKTTVFNPNNYPDEKYPQFNTEPIKYFVTKDLEIDQYTIM
jgi:hypothetical protein